jgi:hypothetical protein
VKLSAARRAPEVGLKAVRPLRRGFRQDRSAGPALRASHRDRCGRRVLSQSARERSNVDAVYAPLLEMGANIVHPPEDGPWAPGYYSVLFEDPQRHQA